MAITASSLYRDSVNFLRNYRKTILLLILFVTMVEIFLWLLFQPDFTNLFALLHIDPAATELDQQKIVNMLASLSQDQLIQLMKEFLKFFFILTIPRLISYSLLVSGMVSLISSTTQHQTINISKALIILPKVVVLIVSTFVLTLFLLITSAKIFFIPGIIFSIVVALAPIILPIGKNTIFSSLKQSITLTFANFGTLVPTILLTLVAKTLLFIVATNLASVLNIPSVSVIICLIGINLIDGLLIIFFYRFYTVVTKNRPL